MLQLTQDEQESLLRHIASGNGLFRWCEANHHDYSAVNLYLTRNEEFSQRYARARDDQADKLADDIVEIADDGTNDSYIDEKGQRKTDFDVIARSKLRVDARKWVAAKLKPGRYGDKLGLGGAEGMPAIATTSTFVINGVKPNGAG